MKRKFTLLIGLVFVIGFMHRAAYGQSIMVGPDRKFKKQVLSVPYAFYNSSFGLAAAYAYAVTGWPQKQSALISSAMVGTTGSVMGFVMGRDLQIPRTDRLFLDVIAQVGYFQDNDIYVNGKRKYFDKRSGSNDSNKDDYVNSDGWDNFFRFRFKYLLPIGHGKENIINTYVVDRGLMIDGATGGESWNPLVSGRTYLELKPFYRSQEVDSDEVQETSKTNGMEFVLFHDNRDFKFNPSTGSHCGSSCRETLGGSIVRTPGQSLMVNSTSIFLLGSRIGFVSECWLLISGQPTRPRGTNRRRMTSPTARRLLLVPPWVGSGGCGGIPRSGSAIKRASTIPENSG